MPVRFFQEDCSVSLRNKRLLKTWIEDIVQNHNAEVGEVNYIFCSDEYLLRINIEYLDHNFYTDIITFNQSEEEGVISADIYISIDRVKENAKINRKMFREEIRRVMAHGILHLLGFNDHNEEDKGVMREKEEASLSLYKE